MIILVIEDQEDLRHSIKSQLESLGKEIDVVCAENGREGFSIALAVPLDFVLTDIQMPEMDGIQFLKTIKELKPDLPVLMMTGNPDFEDRDLLASGAMRVLRKPFAKIDLVEAVRSIKLIGGMTTVA